MMHKFKLSLILLLSSFAVGQNFMTITGQHIYGGGNQLLPSGQVLFQPVDNQGRPIGYQIGGGGQQIFSPTICSIKQGAIVQPCQVANVSLTNPINVCFSATIKSSNNQIILGGPQSGYTCVQPQTVTTPPQPPWCAAGSCNFDQYVPNLPAAVTALIGPPGLLQMGAIFSGDCDSGFVAIGYGTNGHPDCTPGGGGEGGVQDPGANGIMKRTALNITAPATLADITATLGYTAANNSLVGHLAGSETFTGAKTFTLPIIGSLAGNATSSSALDHLPVSCGVGLAARGILATGDSFGCFSLTAGLGDPGSNSIVFRSAFNTTRPATNSDVVAVIGYTPANDSSVAHVTGNESINGVKTFGNTIVALAGMTGNASTASSLAGTPTLCPVGQGAGGIFNTGNATQCAPFGILDPGANGIMKRTALNVSAAANSGDVISTLGYTPANDTLAAHLAGAEVFTGAKTFNLASLETGVTNRTGNYLPLLSAANASPLKTLVLDAPNGSLQLQADSGAGANQGGTLNLQSTNGPGAAASASLGLGSSSLLIDANGITISAAVSLRTILTGPGLVQFGNVGGTSGSATFVGSTSGTQSIGCSNAACANFNITGPLSLGSPLANTYGGTGVADLTFSGGTHKAASVNGTVSGLGTPCAQFDNSGNLTPASNPCGTGTGGLADPGSNGVIKRTALNVTAAAAAGDINTTLGYTAANDTLVAHLAGIETFTGVKTFSSPIVGSLTGNASTASALASTPTLCGAGLVSKGIVASGNANCINPPAVGNANAVQTNVSGSLGSDANTTLSGGLLKTLNYGFTSDPNYFVTMALATSINFNITQVVVAGSGCTTPPCVTFSISSTVNPLSWSIGDRFQAASLPASPANLTALNGHDFVVEAKSPGTPTSTITISYSSGIANGTYATTSPGVLNQYAWVFNGNTVVFNRLCSSTSGCPTFGSIRLGSSGPSQADRLTMNDPNLPGGFIALTRATTGNSGRVQLGDTNTNGGVYIPGPTEFVVAPTFDVAAIGSITGNAATATALDHLPTPCSTGNAPLGILANGNSTGCFPVVSLAGDLGGTGASPTVIGTHLAGFTPNFLPKVNGTGNLVTTTISDDGTTTTIASSGGVSLTGGGGAAGMDALGFGTARAVEPSSIGLTAPTSGTAHNPVLPGVPQSGFLKFSTTVSPAGCTASSTILCGTYSTVNLASATDVGSSIAGPVNGGSGVASPTAHGVLLGEAGSPYTSLVGLVGQVLISQGASADPIFTSALQLGGTLTAITGSVKLCGSIAGCATVQSQANFTNYNYNLPTAAGTAGQPLLSGGGGSSPMTFGTLSGNTSTFVTGTGTLTGVGCAQFDVSGNLINIGIACGSGSGGVGTSVVPRLAFYNTTTTLSGAANTAIGDGTAAPILSLTGTSLANEALLVNCTTPTNNCVTMQLGGTNKFFIDNSGFVNLNTSLRLSNNQMVQNQTASQNLIYGSGIDSNATQGNATYRAGDMVGNGANTAGSTLVRGGDCTGTGACTAGNLELRPGVESNASPNASAVLGTVTFEPVAMKKGTTVTSGNAQCVSANHTTNDCLTTGANPTFVGIGSTVNGGSAYIQTGGTATLNLDASSTWAAGDLVCISLTGAALFHMNGTTVCTGRRAGFAIDSGSAATTVKAMLSIN